MKPAHAPAPTPLRLNPNKLLLSKWTATQPSGKEKHFMVVKVHKPDTPTAPIEWVDLEAVMTQRVQRIVWQQLANTALWQQGWL
ncbi:MAG TPA: TIGR02450 family Trp-rich protein [bacterium]|nr:TIGR02450 family Trp-rich protein [bacterium]